MKPSGENMIMRTVTASTNLIPALSSPPAGALEAYEQMLTLQYWLTPGEATWQLVVTKAVEFE